MNKRHFSFSFVLLAFVAVGAALPAWAQQSAPAKTDASSAMPDKNSATEPQGGVDFSDAESSLIGRKFPQLKMERLLPAAAGQGNPKDALALVHLWPNAEKSDCASVEATLNAWSELLSRIDPGKVFLLTITTKDSSAAKCIQAAAAKEGLKDKAVFGTFVSHFQTEIADFRAQFGHTLSGQPATLVYDKLQTSWRGFVGPLALAKDVGEKESKDAATYRAEEILKFTNLLLLSQKAAPLRAAGYDMRIAPIATARGAFARNLVGTVVHPRMCAFWGNFAKENRQEATICNQWARVGGRVGSLRVLLLADKRHDKTKGAVYASMNTVLASGVSKKAKQGRPVSFEFLPNQSGDGMALLLLVDSQNMIRYAQVVKADVSDAGESRAVLERLLTVLPPNAKKLPFSKAKVVPNR